MNTKKITGDITVGDARTISFIASHELPDRDSEVILISGIDDSEFLNNPVLLLQHNSRSIAVARVTSLRRTSINGAAALVGEATFPDRPQSNDVLADIRAGLLGAVSIGFRSVETGPPRLKGQSGLTHTKIKLLEISLVTLPACPTCLVTSKAACSCDEVLAVTMPSTLDQTLACASDSLARSISRGLAGAVARAAFSSLDEADATPETVNKILGQAIPKAIADIVRHEVHQAILYHTGRVD